MNEIPNSNVFFAVCCIKIGAGDRKALSNCFGGNNVPAPTIHKGLCFIKFRHPHPTDGQYHPSNRQNRETNPYLPVKIEK
jgi:hypothetical protein